DRLVSRLRPRRPPSPPLFPYTTLFRSPDGRLGGKGIPQRSDAVQRLVGVERDLEAAQARLEQCQPRVPAPLGREAAEDGDHLVRSEEHTSELQSVKISYAVFCLKKKTR